MAAMLSDSSHLPIPGSIVIVETDLDNHGPTAAGSPDKLVLSPTPSNDVNDPLRWTQMRKHVTMAMIMMSKADTTSAWPRPDAKAHRRLSDICDRFRHDRTVFSVCADQPGERAVFRLFESGYRRE